MGPGSTVANEAGKHAQRCQERKKPHSHSGPSFPWLFGQSGRPVLTR